MTVRQLIPVLILTVAAAACGPVDMSTACFPEGTWRLDDELDLSTATGACRNFAKSSSTVIKLGKDKETETKLVRVVDGKEGEEVTVTSATCSSPLFEQTRETAGGASFTRTVERNVRFYGNKSEGEGTITASTALSTEGFPCSVNFKTIVTRTSAPIGE